MIISAAAVCAPAQTASGTKITLGTQTQKADFLSFGFTRPLAVGTTLPSTWPPGPLLFNSAAAAEFNLYSCTARNTWTPPMATALASTPTGCPPAQYAIGINASGNANCAQVTYSRVTGTPMLSNQTVQVNGTSQVQAGAVPFSAGSNITFARSTVNGVIAVPIRPSPGVTGPSSSTNYALPFCNGSAGHLLGSSQITIDALGDVTTGGTVIASSFTSSASGPAALVLSQRMPELMFTSDSVTIYTPSSIATVYQCVLPSSDASGTIISDEKGTPGHLSIAKVITQVTAPSTSGQSCTPNTYRSMPAAISTTASRAGPGSVRR